MSWSRPRDRLARRLLSVGLALSAFGATRVEAAEPPPPESDRASGFEVLRLGRGRREIDLGLVRKGIAREDPKDGIPAILHPRTVPAAEAAHLGDGDSVVGVALGGEARAYPIRMLDRHEVANDVLGGRPVAVTYCPLCDAAVAFGRGHDWDPARADEPPLTFGISGYLYESDVLLYDHQTETFWTQMGARGALGPLTGVSLETLPVARTTWKAWRTAHPGTTALSPETEHGWRREVYGQPLYVEYRASKQLLFPVAAVDPRLPKKEVVYGLSVGRDAVAVRLGALERRAGPIDLRLGGRAVRAAVDPTTGALRAELLPEEGAGGGAPVEVPVLRAYWFAWAVFHPGTAVWAPEEAAR
jgi:hypothetical protein